MSKQCNSFIKECNTHGKECNTHGKECNSHVNEFNNQVNDRDLFTDDFFTNQENKKLILSGAAAVARGAFQAGAGMVLTYPGSPVVETFELLASEKSPLKKSSEIVINESVALHKALGFSMSRGRSLVIMKHVGLNVSADPAHYAGYLGVKGGMVILVGSDAGAKCSTGEFDCRFYSLHTHLPIIEPSDFQQALDYTVKAFKLSEKVGLPIMIFLPSSLCYGMGTVTTGPVKKRDYFQSQGCHFEKSRKYTNVGPNAVKSHQILLQKIQRLSISAPFYAFQNIIPETNLIITSGVYRDFVIESLKILNLQDRISIYCPGLTYPIEVPEFMNAVNSSGCKNMLFVEELEGFLEMQMCHILMKSSSSMKSSSIDLKGSGSGQMSIKGKEYFPAWGALGITDVKEGIISWFNDLLGISTPVLTDKSGPKLLPVMREGTFCPGCPHRAFFYSLNSLLKTGDIIGGDIGCSSLPPHYSDWLTCMNSGTSIAAGVASAVHSSVESKQKVVSLIGDSTLFHSGIQTLIDAVQKDSEQVCFILDNSWTAMTGHQQTNSSKRDLQGKTINGSIDIMKLLKAINVKKVSSVDPIDVLQMKRTVLKHFDIPGFSCVIVEHECLLQNRRRVKNLTGNSAKNSLAPWESTYQIVQDRCVKCNECYSILNCPAIYKDDQGDIRIDSSVCKSCGVCHTICPNNSIVRIKKHD